MFFVLCWIELSIFHISQDIRVSVILTTFFGHISGSTGPILLNSKTILAFFLYLSYFSRFSQNIATRWDPYIIWWDPYDSYPHDSDLFILFEVCNNSLKGSSYIIYPILYTLIY